MLTNAEQNARLAHAREKVCGSQRQRHGIGTLSEKTLHAILKNYYQPNESHHEIPVGRYCADIFDGKEIVEIQTAQFNRMRQKLEVFLPEYKTTIVYPIAREKWINWIDEETGEVRERRKSPKKGNPYMAFKELYKIKMHLKDKNIRVHLLMMEIEEYKLLDGWGEHKKNHATKYDRIPSQIYEEYVIERKEDYMQFVPFDEGENYTSKDFAKKLHISKELATVTLNILEFMEVVERTGRKGNAYIYQTRY